MDEPFKIIIPDEQVQIGVNAEGHPIYIETKDLVNTGDENAELQDNREKTLLRGADEKMVKALIDMFDRFVANTLGDICPQSILDKGAEALQVWVKENDINWVLDESENQITFVFRRKDKIVRTMPVRFKRPAKGDDEEAHVLAT